MLKKGTKFENGYMVGEKTMDYREISAYISKNFDWKIEYNTARNYTLSGLEKIADELITELLDEELLDEDIEVTTKNLMNNKLFHEALSVYLNELKF